MFHFLNACSVRIRYRLAGTGHAIVLLHGWGSSIESFNQVFADFSSSYKVVAIDFPGHGESGMPPTAWSVSDFADCLLSVLDQLELQQPHIIAHSFGGRVAIKLAVGYPDRVGSLVLVDAAGVPAPRGIGFRLKVSLGRAGKYAGAWLGPVGRSFQNRVYKMIRSRDYADAGELRGTFVKVIGEDLTAMLPRIKSRTLLVWGEQDKDTPVVSGRLMSTLIPNSQFVLLKDAGHFSFIDQFSLFRLFVRKFLAS